MKGIESVLDLTHVLGSTNISPALDWNVILDITKIAGTVKDKERKIPPNRKNTQIYWNYCAR
jgi:predicted membrane protein